MGQREHMVKADSNTASLKFPPQPAKSAAPSPGEVARTGHDRSLNVLVLYEDSPTREWSGEVCSRVAGLAEPDALRVTWWKMSDLSEPGVLAGAVSKAMRADVIVVAIRATDGLPLPFYVWVDSWLPHRPQGTGALVALLGFPERFVAPMERAREYLKALARKGHLDFLIEERKLPLALEASGAGEAAPSNLILHDSEAADRIRKSGTSGLWRTARLRSKSAVAA
jgi:hypothetical protein